MADLPGAAGQAAQSPAPVTRRLARFALVRALPALVAGLITAFTGGHTPAFGLALFGGWAILDALLALWLLAPAGLLDARSRALLLARALVVGIGGLLAVALSGTGALTLVLATGVVALAAGGLDLAAGIRSRGALAVSRDLVISGAVTLLLGVAALLIPSDLQQPYPGAEGHPGVLTAPIIVTGLFGGWGVITGVLWAIAAVGLRWPPRRSADPVGTDPATTVDSAADPSTGEAR